MSLGYTHVARGNKSNFRFDVLIHHADISIGVDNFDFAASDMR